MGIPLTDAATYEGMCGRPDRAADLLLDGVELGVTLPRGGPMAVGLVGTEIQADCERPLELLLSNLSSSALMHVAARLEGIEKRRVPYSDLVMEENYAETASVLNYCTPERHCEQTGFGTGEDDQQSDSWEGFRFLIGNKRTMLHENQVYARRLAEEAKSPYAGPSRVPAPKGRFPHTLSELTPPYLGQAPVDPFGGGKPLRYQATKGRNAFLLYSLGPDMIDRGGLPVRSPGIAGGNMVAGALWRNGKVGVSRYARG